MNYSKQQNKEFAIYLLLIKLRIDISKMIDKIMSVNRDDLSNKELLKIIKKLEKSN